MTHRNPGHLESRVRLPGPRPLSSQEITARRCPPPPGLKKVQGQGGFLPQLSSPTPALPTCHFQCNIFHFWVVSPPQSGVDAGSWGSKERPAMEGSTTVAKRMWGRLTVAQAPRLHQPQSPQARGQRQPFWPRWFFSSVCVDFIPFFSLPIPAVVCGQRLLHDSAGKSLTQTQMCKLEDG